MVRAPAPYVIALLSAVVLAGCGDVNVALARLSEAREVAADLQVQFTKANDAANRAVMATTDASSVAFAKEADAARQAVEADISRLRSILTALGYGDETGLLDDFATQFKAYQTLDRRVLELAVENTNLKAQRLAHGASQEAADAVRDALEAAVAAAPARDQWQARSHALAALAALREIQVLQAPHIAERDDAAMDRIEARMRTAGVSVEDALNALAALGPRAEVARAREALTRFQATHTEILALSRRNTNVMSVILTFEEKQKLVPSCEASLRALRGALGKRGYPVGRTN
jgi:hypothetical protein